MGTELVIFDCDGVLVDSEAVASEVLARCLRELGLDYTPHRADERFRGRSLKDIVQEIETELGCPVPNSFLPDLEQKTSAAFEADLKAVPGVEELLVSLETTGIDVCVASSGTKEKIELSLRLTGLARFFEDRLFSANQVERGKPAPDVFLFAAQEMGHSIERSVVIEDSLAGVKGATASGAQVIGYVSPSLSIRDAHEKALRELGAIVTGDLKSALPLICQDRHGS